MRQLIDLLSSNRVVDIATPLPPGTMAVETLKGVETLGRLFEYEMTVLSHDGNLVFDELLGKHVTALILQQDESRRAVDGRVAQMGLTGMVDNYYRYRLVLRPWLWMLSLTADCRIFQEKNAKEIIELVFADQPDADFEFNLSADYAPREYCVQYRETDFEFVSRLMEEEGMYYFFRHENGKHTLVICDAPGAHESLGVVPYMSQNRARAGREHIREWSVTREIRPGKFAMRDYNFKRPSVDMTLALEQQRAHAEAGHEVYDYPGEYPEMPVGEHLIRTRLDELQASYEVVEGRGNSRILACGGKFEFSEFGREDQNGEFLIVSLDLDVSNNLPESSREGGETRFEVRFRLMPAADPYRSARSTRRPVVQGPQTAVVVGPSGEEIHVDEYGRVKVQFHWDRYGQKDDKSSCWIRVSQNWAGKNFGWMTVPRIGQEVIVDFLEGNPDDPIITGRVYNAEQMPPWALPANKTQSGILTRSSAGGSPANANHLKFEDKKGSELIDIHAEKDMTTHVEHDDSTSVGNNQSTSVNNDQSTSVGHDQSVTVKHDQQLQVDNDRRVTVKKDESRRIEGKQVLEVVKDQSLAIDANQQTLIKGNQTTDVKGNRVDSTTGNETRTVTGNQSFTVTGNIEYQAANIKLQAAHIDILPTGSSSLVVTSPSGPYQIMANKFQVLSNTDVDLFAIANINATSMGNNTTVMGPNNSGYAGMASETNLGLARSTFLGLALDTFVGAQISATVALQLEQVAAAKLSLTAGPDLELKTIKMIIPGGGGAGGGAAVAAQAGPVWAVALLGAGAGANILSAGLGFAEIYDQYKTAGEQLNQAAKDAAAAGHPGLAARLNRLSKMSTVLGIGDPGAPETPDNNAPRSTQEAHPDDWAHSPAIDGPAPSGPTTDNAGNSTANHPAGPHGHGDGPVRR